MYRKSERVPHPQNRAEGVGAGAQVGNFAQKFERVPLGLQGVFFGVGGAVDVDVADFQLHRLPAAL